MNRILFVCLGNICRSPLAEAILRRYAEEADVSIEVDSAGLGNWHVGERSDVRAIEVGTRRGYRMDHRARQVKPADFERFDLLVAMDHENVSGLRRLAGAHHAKIVLARSFDSEAEGEVVADPYYGELDGFELCADQLEAACRGLLNQIIASRLDELPGP